MSHASPNWRLLLECARRLTAAGRTPFTRAQLIEPYDVTLKDEPPARRRVWSQQVLADLSRVLGDLDGAVFEIHAGLAYRDSGLVEGLEDRGAVVEVPAEGLGLGEQLHFYGRAAEETEEHVVDPGLPTRR